MTAILSFPSPCAKHIRHVHFLSLYPERDSGSFIDLELHPQSPSRTGLAYTCGFLVFLVQASVALNRNLELQRFYILFLLRQLLLDAEQPGPQFHHLSGSPGQHSQAYDLSGRRACRELLLRADTGTSVRQGCAAGFIPLGRSQLVHEDR